ncbi:MAG: flagellar basal body-associated FliL family protein [Alphaproteobacteria bacterium]|nr:flagellar basal body-associated FliL family protein [Alphaproteobacteria bacterium]
MIQQIVLGVWVCLATLGGIYGADILFSATGADAKTVHVGGLAYTTIESITVPVLREGSVEGYVVAQFVYGIRDTGDKHIAERVGPHVVDSVFRVLYGQAEQNVRRPDLDAVKKEVRERVNASLGEQVVEEILIDKLNYISSEQVRCSKQVQ